MALDCSPIQNQLSTRCILLPYVTSIIRSRLLFHIPWWHTNIQHFMGRILTAPRNCFHPPTNSRFENQTQQMPVLKQNLHHLGHLISEQGIQSLQDKIMTITNFAETKNIDELHHFLWLTGYCRRFIPLFTDIMRPLNTVLRKDKKFHCSTQF